MPNVLGFGRVDRVLADVLGVIANPFEMAGDEK
jgi:hypothetical protein